MAKVLIIDDEPNIRKALREILEYEKHEVFEAENAKMGLDILKKDEVNVVLCDIKMPGMDGLEFLDAFEYKDAIPVIMITGHGDVETAVDAMHKGAFDFIQKPIDLNRLLISLRNALEREHLIIETKKLKKKINKKYDIIGESPAIQALKALIEKVAPTNSRVLITGENGTGKELVAHWLHEKSHRNTAPLIEVNCAAIPSELIESELFGHEKGSFTSAVKQRKGDFELADKGTLFLDEIGDMNLAAQAKILRALQEGKITRVGGEKEIPVDVRVITATNKSLPEEIKNKNFREDLFYRLNTVQIHVPPLRERIEDIPLLAEHFMKQMSESDNTPLLTITDEAIAALQELPWRGNIREFRNVIERFAILCNKQVTADDVKKYVSIYNV